MAFLAALQHAIATVGTRGPLTDSLLGRVDGQALQMADVEDPNAFQSAVQCLAEDRWLRQHLGHAAQQLYDFEFAWDKKSWMY